MSVPQGFEIESAPKSSLPAGFEIESAPKPSIPAGFEVESTPLPPPPSISTAIAPPSNVTPPTGAKYDPVADAAFQKRRFGSSAVRQTLGDAGVALAKGVVGVPETVVGLADIPTMGLAGKGLEKVGINFKEAQDSLNELYSPEARAAQERVGEGFDQGIIPGVKAIVENPSTIMTGAIESTPTMFGGGAIGRGVLKAVPALSKLVKAGEATGATKAAIAGAQKARIIAGGVGEGAVTAGQNIEQVRQQTETGTLTPAQVALNTASGILTGVLGVAGGKMAQKLGLADIDTLMTGGTAARRGVVMKAIGGMVSEGLLEELPQSIQEQIAQNLSLGKPWDEGVAQSGAMGAVIGGIMGAGANVSNAATEGAQRRQQLTRTQALRQKMLEGRVRRDAAAQMQYADAMKQGLTHEQALDVVGSTDPQATFDAHLQANQTAERLSTEAAGRAMEGAQLAYPDTTPQIQDQRFQTYLDAGYSRAEAIANVKADQEADAAGKGGIPRTDSTGLQRATLRRREASTVSEELRQKQKEWDTANRTHRSDEWFAGANVDANARQGFSDALVNGGDQIQAHGMAKERTLQGAIDNLSNLLRNNLDPNRGGGRLDTAPLVSRPGEGLVGATPTGSAYSDGPFMLVVRPGTQLNDMRNVSAILVNQTHAGMIDELRAHFQAVRPDVIVEPYSNAGKVAAQLNATKPQAAIAGPTVSTPTPVAKAQPAAKPTPAKPISPPVAGPDSSPGAASPSAVVPAQGENSLHVGDDLDGETIVEVAKEQNRVTYTLENGKTVERAISPPESVPTTIQPSADIKPATETKAGSQLKPELPKTETPDIENQRMVVADQYLEARREQRQKEDAAGIPPQKHVPSPREEKLRKQLDAIDEKRREIAANPPAQPAEQGKAPRKKLYRGTTLAQWNQIQRGEQPQSEFTTGGNTWATTNLESAQGYTRETGSNSVIIEYKDSAHDKVSKLTDDPGDHRRQGPLGLEDVQRVTDGNGKVIYEAPASNRPAQPTRETVNRPEPTPPLTGTQKLRKQIDAKKAAPTVEPSLKIGDRIPWKNSPNPNEDVKEIEVVNLTSSVVTVRWVGGTELTKIPRGAVEERLRAKPAPQAAQPEEGLKEAKAPWQMTRAEAIAQGIDELVSSGMSREDAIDFGTKGFEDSHRKEVNAAIGRKEPIPAEVLADYPDLKPLSKTEDTRAKLEASRKPSTPVEPVSTKVEKATEPWMMTRAEYVADAKSKQDKLASGMGKKLSKLAKWNRNPTARGIAEDAHKDSVRSAVLSGKPVSASVLADYPELDPTSKTEEKPLDTLRAKIKVKREGEDTTVSAPAADLFPDAQSEPPTLTQARARYDDAVKAAEKTLAEWDKDGSDESLDASRAADSTVEAWREIVTRMENDAVEGTKTPTATTGGPLPIIQDMMNAARESVKDIKDNIANVRFAPYEKGQKNESILFELDGVTHRGELRGRNKDLVIGSGIEQDKGIAARVWLDGDAKPAPQTKLAALKEKGGKRGKRDESRPPLGDVVEGKSKALQSARESMPFASQLISDVVKSDSLPETINYILNIDNNSSKFLNPSEFVNSDSSPRKSLLKSVPADAKLFGDIIGSSAFLKHGFSGLDVKTKRLVLSHVVRLSGDEQVLRSVVQFIPVDVMNDLVSEKTSINDLLRNPSMLKAAVSGYLSEDISLVGDMADALIRSFALAGAVKDSGLIISDLVRPSKDGNLANKTFDLDHAVASFINNKGDNTRHLRESQVEIKTRPTDKGVAMYSRSTGLKPVADESPIGETNEPGAKEDRESLQRVSEALSQETGEAVEFEYRPSEGAVTGPELVVLQEFADLFRKRIVFFRGGGRVEVDGFTSRLTPDRIFLNVDSEKSLALIMGHELTHEMRRDNPEIYDELKTVVMRNVARVQEFADTMPGADESRIHEEVTASIVGDQFGSGKLWETLAKENPSLFDRVAKIVMDFIDEVLAKVNSRTYVSKRMVTDVYAARRAVATAINKYAQSRSTKDRLGVAMYDSINKEKDNEREGTVRKDGIGETRLGDATQSGRETGVDRAARSRYDRRFDAIRQGAIADGGDSAWDNNFRVSDKLATDPDFQRVDRAAAAMGIDAVPLTDYFKSGAYIKGEEGETVVIREVSDVGTLDEGRHELTHALQDRNEQNAIALTDEVNRTSKAFIDIKNQLLSDPIVKAGYEKRAIRELGIAASKFYSSKNRDRIDTKIRGYIANEIAAAYSGGKDFVADAFTNKARADKIRESVHEKIGLKGSESLRASRSDTTTGMTPSAVHSAIADLERQHGIKATVNPEGVNAGEQQGERITLNANRITDADHARRVYREELVHMGIRSMTADEWRRLMDSTFNLKRAEYQAMVEKVRQQYPEYAEGSPEFREEVIAHIGQISSKPGLWDRFIAVVRKFLRARGWVKTMTDSDVDAMVREALGNVGKGGEEVRASRNDRAKVITPAQDARYLELAKDPEANRDELQAMVDEAAKAAGVYWHGTASGDLRGGTTGLHVGTHRAATEALEAAIGIPADGRGWDGTREYGDTLLAGSKRIESGQFGKYRNTGYNSMAPEQDYYAKDHAEGLPKHSNGDRISANYKPYVRPVMIIGGMSNKTYSPMGDWQANGIMRGMLNRGKAKNGYYYKNIGEDAGSVSAVLPNGEHVRVKLADPITRDDQGRVIPLSERFNEASPDIRYSRGESQQGGNENERKRSKREDGEDTAGLNDAGGGESERVVLVRLRRQRRLDAIVQSATGTDQETAWNRGLRISDDLGRRDAFMAVAAAAERYGIETIPLESFITPGALTEGDEGRTIVVADRDDDSVLYVGRHELTHELQRSGDQDASELSSQVNVRSSRFREVVSDMKGKPHVWGELERKAKKELGIPPDRELTRSESDKVNSLMIWYVRDEISATKSGGRTDVDEAFKSLATANQIVKRIHQKIGLADESVKTPSAKDRISLFDSVTEDARTQAERQLLEILGVHEHGAAQGKEEAKAGYMTRLDDLKKQIKARADEARAKQAANVNKVLAKVGAGPAPIPKTDAGITSMAVKTGKWKATATLGEMLREYDGGQAAQKIAEGRMSLRGAVTNLINAKAGETAALRREIIAKAKESIPDATIKRSLTRHFMAVLMSRNITDERFNKALAQIDAEAERIQKRELVSAIKAAYAKSSESMGVNVLYRQRIKRLMDKFLTTESDDGTVTSKPILFTKPSAATLAEAKILADFLEEERNSGSDMDLTLNRHMARLIRALSGTPLIDMPVASLEDLFSQIHRLGTIGRIYQQAKTEGYKESQDNAIERLKGSMPIEEHLRRTESPLSDKELSMADKFHNLMAATSDAMKRWYVYHMPMDVVFDLLDGAKHYAGANYRLFKSRIDLAFSAFRGGMHPLENELADKIKELGIGKSESERVGAYAIDRQETGRQKLLNTLSDGTEADDARVNKMLDNLVLTDNEKAFYDWMRGKLDAIRPAIERVMKETYNAEMDKVEHYFPFITDWNLMEAARDMYGLEQDDTGAWVKTKAGEGGLRKNVAQGFTKSRRGAGKQAVKFDAIRAFHKHMQDVNYYVHVGPTVKYLQEIANRPEYATAVGNIGQRIVREYLDTMARQGGMGGSHILRWVDSLRNNIGVGTLGFRLSSILIQPSSFFDGAGMIGGRWAFKGALHVTQKEWRDFMWDNMTEIHDRLGGEWALAEATLKSNMAKYGFLPLRALDELTAGSIASGAYEKNLHERGLEVDFSNPDAEALAYAQKMVRRTQASADYKDQPLAVTRGALMGGSRTLARAIYQFQTFSMNKFSFMAHDGLYSAIKNKEPMAGVAIMAWTALAFTMEEMIRAGIRAAPGGSGDDNEPEDIAKAFLMDYLQIVPWFGSAVSALQYNQFPAPVVKTISDTATGLKSAMFSKTAEARQRGLARMAGGAGTMAGIPGTSQAAQWARNAIKSDPEEVTHRIKDSAKALPKTASRGYVWAKGVKLHHDLVQEGLLPRSSKSDQFKRRYEEAWKRLRDR